MLFRGFTAAASLKPGSILALIAGRLLFRGFTAAASLKHVHSVGFLPTRSTLPRLHRRGLIEAR